MREAARLPQQTDRIMIDGGPPAATLFSAGRIRQRVRELAADIEADTPSDVTLHMVGMLAGSFMFLADLARSFSRPVTIDFARCTSYRDGKSPGAGVWTLEPRGVNGKHVLIVEDIVDTGTTLHALRGRLLAQEPAWLRTVCLLDKPAKRRVETPVEFVGFTIDDVFVVGYGLDHAERYRHLPYIAALPP